jgi:hypothetical protein
MTLQQIHSLAVQLNAAHLPIHTFDMEDEQVSKVEIKYFDSQTFDYVDEKELYSHIAYAKDEDETTQYYRENYITKVLTLA